MIGAPVLEYLEYLKFVIGLKFAMSVWSSPGFFDEGVTRPCLSDDGNTPVLKDMFASLAFEWTILFTHMCIIQY